MSQYMGGFPKRVSMFYKTAYILYLQVYDFRSITDSIFTLFRMILGDFNFKAIESASTFLGPVYFLSYIFFVFFVLLVRFSTYWWFHTYAKIIVVEHVFGHYQRHLRWGQNGCEIAQSRFSNRRFFQDWCQQCQMFLRHSGQVHRMKLILKREISFFITQIFHFYRGIDVENAIKLAAADDGYVTYDELRENLRK